VGNPAKVVKEVSDKMIDWKTKGTQLYQALPAEMMEHWEACEPLRELDADRPMQESLYTTWEAIK
jgi:phenylacetic acid degradation protein/carnitine operon protein CaiE